LPRVSILPKKVARAKKVLAPPWPSKISKKVAQFALAQQNFKKKTPSSLWPSEIFQFADPWF
jgi:hypothetical protein